MSFILCYFVYICLKIFCLYWICIALYKNLYLLGCQPSVHLIDLSDYYLYKENLYVPFTLSFLLIHCLNKSAYFTGFVQSFLKTNIYWDINLQYTGLACPTIICTNRILCDFCSWILLIYLSKKIFTICWIFIALSKN